MAQRAPTLGATSASWGGSVAHAAAHEISEIKDLPEIGQPPIRPAAWRHEEEYAGTRPVVLVDVNGIHELPVAFCRCPNAPTEGRQLLRAGYYPATTKRPAVAFSFNLMDDFLLTNRECKTAARNYYTKLRRLTNAAFPHMAPVCSASPVQFIEFNASYQDKYKEFLRVSRQWRNLRLRQAGGVVHQSGVVEAGGLAVGCPSCPQPDINIPADWKQEKDE